MTSTIIINVLAVLLGLLLVATEWTAFLWLSKKLIQNCENTKAFGAQSMVLAAIIILVGGLAADGVVSITVFCTLALLAFLALLFLASWLFMPAKEHRFSLWMGRVDQRMLAATAFLRN
jgi:hypothetical protein